MEKVTLALVLRDHLMLTLAYTFNKSL